MRLKPTALAAAGMALLLAGCTQASIETPSIGTSVAAKTLADSAFNDTNTALPLVYTNDDSTSPVTPPTGLAVTGTSSLAASVQTFNETVTMTDYDALGTDGIFATGDVVMKGTLNTSTGVGKYTYTGDLFMSGSNGNGHVVLNLSLSTTSTTTSYSGTATVAGTEYTYSGSQ